MILKMMPGKTCVYVLILVLGLSDLTQLFGQGNIPIGTWRTHLPYNRASLVEISGNYIFCSGENTLFYYDTEDYSLHKLTKSDGFSDVGITAMGYYQDMDITLFGYQNGNLDMLEGNIITNYNAIKKTTVPYGKDILDIDYHSEYAYLTTVFGVFVLRLELSETKEVYRNLGNEGQHIDLGGAEILRDTIFLVCEDGVLAGSLDPSVNLMDFNNWKRYNDTDGMPVISGKDITSDGKDIFALMSNEDLYFYREGKWTNSEIQLDEPVLSVTGTPQGILITTESNIYSYHPSVSIQSIDTGPSENPNMALLDSNEKIWIADGLNGLVTNVNGPHESYFPSGVFSEQVFRVKYGSGMIVTVPGGYNSYQQPLGNDDGFSVFIDGFWTNYNNSGMAGSIPIGSNFEDLTDLVIYNEKIVFASFGDGLVDFMLPDMYSVTDAETVGSTLNYSLEHDSLTLIGSVTNDRDGNDWLINYDTDFPLQKRDQDGTWTSFSIPEYPKTKYALQLMVPYSDEKWFRMNPDLGGGILVHNEISGKNRFLSTETGNGGLPSSIINDMIEDKEGQIWVATSKGVAYFVTSIGITGNESIDAIIPIFDNRYLLRNEYITSIEIDGGNRKWVGTRKGAWLFSTDGSHLIENFNTDNSPILSDNILDIEIDDISGEVFFVTDKGLISYRGTATEAEETHSRIKIFPNPVTADFTGIVGIEGLAQDAVVKITDVSGKKIWETRANGGTATWNVTDYQGRRASSGIYLVFSSTSNGDDTFVGKIAVIN
jgi:hypothetical protein